MSILLDLHSMSAASGPGLTGLQGASEEQGGRARCGSWLSMGVLL